MSKRISLISWVILGIVGLVVFIAFFSHAFPVASIDITLTREDAFKKAFAFVKGQGFALEGFDKTVIFSSDSNASIYLQKTRGIKKSNELIRDEIPVWFWRVRWFKELEKEGFYLDINPSSGEIVRFSHFVPENEEGENLTQDEARRLAEEKVRLQNIDLRDYELKESGSKERKNRTDHYFVWEKRGYEIEDGRLRVVVNICGDMLGSYRRYLKVPEDFLRQIRKETSFGGMLSMFSDICIFLLMLGAIFLIVARYKDLTVNWRFGLIFACTVMPMKIFDFLNSIPLLWSSYSDTVSKPIFITTAFGNVVNVLFLQGALIFSYGILGKLLSSDSSATKTPLFCDIQKKNFSFSRSAPVFIVGYSLGFVFLGYLSLFYLIATKFFNVWMPPKTEYSNILGTVLPFIAPLTIAMTAAIREEIMFRLFSISFLKKFLKKTWLAVLLSALIWAFAHSSYPVFPVYVRGVELTIFGIILGIVYLKYGLEAVMIAHFVINSSLVGLPLLKSHNPYLIISGILVIAIAFLPVFIAGFIRKAGK